MKSINIKQIINNLVKKYGCTINRNQNFDYNNDIDIEIKDNNYSDIQKYLKSKGFIEYNENKSKSHFYIFENSDLIHIDLIKNRQYIKKFFNIDTKDISVFSEDINSKILRYCLMLRTEKYGFLKKNQNHINSSDIFNNKILKEILFKPSYKSLKSLLKRKKLYKNVKFKYIVKLYFNIFKSYIKAFNSGIIISILGSDGSGKSTIANILKDKLNCKYFYMGGRGFYFENMYNKYGNNIYLKFPFFLLRYIENIFRYIKIYSYKLRGYIVITDRYAKRDLMIMKKNIPNINKYLFIFFYKYFFPSPDKIVVLYNTPKIINERKNELSIEEIKKYYKNIDYIMKNKKNTFYIKNDLIDKTLNQILKIIF